MCHDRHPALRSEEGRTLTICLSQCICLTAFRIFLGLVQDHFSTGKSDNLQGSCFRSEEINQIKLKINDCKVATLSNITCDSWLRVALSPE